MNEIIQDRTGRTISLRRVGVVEQLRLFKVVGPELSENRAYIGLARVAASVAEIEGIPIPFPSSEVSIEAVLERLGEEGVSAVAARFLEPSSEQVLIQAGN